MKTIEALLVTKGHVFEREPFFDMIDALQQPDADTVINWTHVEQPAAAAVLTPRAAAGFDTIVFYDMPGVLFRQSILPFMHYEPTDEYKENFMALLEQGKGMVFLHHAIASWPAWPEFARIVGGRFHFLPGVLGDKQYPGSGFRFNVPQTMTVLDTDHPITKGLDPVFGMTDETYLMPVMEDQVTPLISSDFKFTAEQFQMGGVNFQDHPDGSNLIAWTKQYLNSTIAYLQPGHGPQIYHDPNYRRLITNSVRWSAQAT